MKLEAEVRHILPHAGDFAVLAAVADEVKNAEHLIEAVSVYPHAAVLAFQIAGPAGNSVGRPQEGCIEIVCIHGQMQLFSQDILVIGQKNLLRALGLDRIVIPSFHRNTSCF